MTALPSPLIIGSRGSTLALVQAGLVWEALIEHYPDANIEIKTIVTKGDLITDRPIAAIGDSALFVAAIEEELRAGRIHLAVHSAKDLPSVIPSDMTIAAFLKRADPRDALVSGFASVGALPQRARVGTSSARRTSQLRAIRNDLDFHDIRGNVDTRLAKLENGDYDAIILAMAGLERLDRVDRGVRPLELDALIPAPGQGALAIETRTADHELTAQLRVLNDPDTENAVRAERAFLAAAGGGCSTAVAAHATIAGDTIEITGCIGSLAGRVLRDSRRGAATEGNALAAALAADLLSRGGAALLEADAKARDA